MGCKTRGAAKRTDKHFHYIKYEMHNTHRFNARKMYKVANWRVCVVVTTCKLSRTPFLELKVVVSEKCSLHLSFLQAHNSIIRCQLFVL